MKPGVVAFIGNRRGRLRSGHLRRRHRPRLPNPPGSGRARSMTPFQRPSRAARSFTPGLWSRWLKHKENNAVLVDVSNAPRRPDQSATHHDLASVPHPAIPGAVWIPGAGLGAPPPPMDPFFRQRLAAATGNDLTRPVILYCHEKCWLSWNGAKRAIQYGYRNVYWYPDGIEGWRKAKLPTAVVQPEATP